MWTGRQLTCLPQTLIQRPDLLPHVRTFFVHAGQSGETANEAYETLSSQNLDLPLPPPGCVVAGVFKLYQQRVLDMFRGRDHRGIACDTFDVMVYFMFHLEEFGVRLCPDPCRVFSLPDEERSADNGVDFWETTLSRVWRVRLEADPSLCVVRGEASEFLLDIPDLPSLEVWEEHANRLTRRWLGFGFGYE